MYAVVLVGGFGTRLRPLTSTVPKPMLTVGDRPIIVQLVEQLARAGVTDVVLALGFKPEPFTGAFPDGIMDGVRIHYAVEPEPLDTAGAVRFAADTAGIDDTFVVMNGDVLTDLDITRLVSFHRDRAAEATLHLISVADPSAYGVVALDEESRVRRFVEKPAPGTEPSRLANGGTYVLEASVLDRIPTGRPTSIERVTFPAVAQDGGLFGLATEDYWIDTGRPETFRQANLDTLDGIRQLGSCAGIDPRAFVAEDSVVEHSVIAGGVEVGSRARVVDSVLLTGARIAPDAVVVDSIVAGRVDEGAQVTRTVVGAEGMVAAGEILTGGRRPEVDT
jgi:mannose-1-phosphate guanylyltransferase